MYLNDYKKGINNGELQELARFCNSYLLPTMMLPWGDSLFPHHCGYIYIDVIIQRYLQYCEIKIIDDKNF